MPYVPFPAAPLTWTMRLVKGSTLTHVELDDNQKALNQKINDTQGLNLGSGTGIYTSKSANPNDGFLNFKSLVQGPGVTINTVGNDIIISSSGGTAGTGDTHVSNVTYSADTICIYLNDGTEFCINMSGSTPYEYGTGMFSIQPKRDGSFASADYSNIGGGLNNIVSSGGTYSNIAGGDTNIIRGNYGFIGGGKNNLIQSATTYTSILNGSGNSITVNTQSTAVLGGDNLIGDRSHTTFMNGLDAYTDSSSGQAPFRYHGSWANQGLGRILMDMTGAGDSQWVSSAIFPLMCDDPCPSSGSGIHQITEGYHSGCTLYMTDCSGTTVTADTCCVTTGPYAWRGGIDSITTTLPLMGQAGENIINITAGYSTIQGGLRNRILSGVTFSSILNGSGNTISSTILWPSGSGFTGNTKVTAAAVLGSIGRTAKLSETTYVTGLDALTDGYDGYKKPFTYHGDWANEGNGKVLREIVGNGDARWIYSPFPVVNTGDTCTNIIMSAFTTGHTLTVIDANGNVYTANTCSIFAGPYEYGSGLDSIQPILDSPFATSNFSSIGGGVNNKVIGTKSRYSRIGGGQNNIINSVGTSSADTASLHSYIGGGNINTINESAKSAIVGGESNSITGGTHNIIGSGNNNVINESIKSAIVGGENNLITGGTHNIIGGGEHNLIKPKFTYGTLSGVTADSTTHSIIGAGKDNSIFGSDNSSIVSGSLNLITGGTHNHIGSGINNTLNNTTNTTILNGANNTISASTQSLIGGGSNNTLINGLDSSIINGASNTNIDSGRSIIGGGLSNLLDTVTASTIVAGQENTIGKSDTSSIVSGLKNTITASTQSIIGAGLNNEIVDTSSSSSLISGVGNKVIRSNSTILGSGSANTITHSTNVVLGGGENNLISGETSSSIVGGKDNIILRGATKDYNIIGGGDGNLITNTTKSAIVAGENNTITASTSTIVGSGTKNKIINSDRTALMAGSGNTINVSLDSSLISGVNNTIDDSDSALLGSGLNNSIVGVSNMSSLVSGELNVVTASTHSILGAGLNNRMNSAPHSTLGSGINNLILSGDSNILGSGIKNKITSSDRTALMAGSGNTINLSHGSFIGSGEINLIEKSPSSSIVGGATNIITASTLSIVGGGQTNIITVSDASVIAAGVNNSVINSDRSIIGAGSSNNTTRSSSSLIGSGVGNDIIDSPNTSIVGGRDNFVSGGTSNLIGGGRDNKALGPSSNYTSIVGGKDNFISGGTNNLIGGGGNNKITERSTYTSISSGKDNIIKDNDYSSIVGGEGNLITGGTHNIIGGGNINTIDKSKYSVVDGGGNNKITRGSAGIIGSGTGNTITDSNNTIIGSGDRNQIINSDYTIIGAGQLNVVKEASKYSVIAGGRFNDIYQVSPYSVIGGGKDNNIFSGSSYSIIVGGNDNDTRRSTHSFIGGGTINQNRESKYSIVVGGFVNRNYFTDYSFIGGGSGHTINTDAHFGTIGGGAFNRISRETPYATIAGGQDGFIDCLSPWSIIGGGQRNTIFSGSTHVGIFNGSGNTITEDIIATATIGTVNRVGYVTETTFTRGIDANTDGYDGVDRPLRYHGVWANQGYGRILTDMTGLGDSVWMNGGIYQLCDEYGAPPCPIVSAWTSDSGCTINFIDCTGTTTTADTCCTITGPYAWRGGVDSITTTLPLSGQDKENKIRGTAKYSTIQGGLSNLIRPSVQFSSILNGSGNTINTGADYSAIIGSKGRTAVTPETTYVTGLDALTDGNDGLNKPFRYHGAFASNGVAGWVLEASNALGDAVWAPGPGLPSVPSGCTITGATTLGCITTFHTDCSGFTITADTCDGSYSPYRPVGGTNSITTTLETFGAPNENLVDILSDYSTISAGWRNRIISGSSWSNILGGDDNRIHQASYAAIINGSGNTINHPNSVIMGGDKITTDRISTVFMNGLDVNTNSITAVSGLTQQPFKYHGTFANNGNPGDVLTSVDTLGNATWKPLGFPNFGSGCTLTGITQSAGVITYHLAGSGCTSFTASTVGSNSSPYRYNINGGNNAIEPILPGNNFADAASSNIQGGDNNLIQVNSLNSSILGGQVNRIRNNSSWSNIGGGIQNTIDDSRVSSILGGFRNDILIPGLMQGYGLITAGFQNLVTEEYGTVINGSGNTVNDAYSVVIGSQGKTTDRQYTTFMEGLDVDTGRGGVTNAQAFRYHGQFANNGNAGDVLTSTDAFGNAQWQPVTILDNDPNCPVVSAFTTNSGCTLNLVDCSGNTVTADTCNQFGSYSPYEIGAGLDAIQPILPLGPVNKNKANGQWTNIGGGVGNRIAIPVATSNIAGGAYNEIVEKTAGALIGGGQSNYITDSSFGGIVVGLQNIIREKSDYATILGGKDNVIAGDSNESSIGGGSNNVISGSSSSMVGNGQNNTIIKASEAPSDNSFIGTGTFNTLSGSSISSIVSGSNNKITLSEGSMVGSGYGNEISREEHAFIGGGSNNTIKGPSAWKAFIGAGMGNTIDPYTRYSSIVGGFNNLITKGNEINKGWNSILGGEENTISGTSYSAIVNGKNNLIEDVGMVLDSVAVIGGSNIIANRDNTTFMEGLDVNTNLNGPNRPFRYHGTFAAEGTPGHVLTSFNANGDAYWAEIPGGQVTLYSGCPIMSAFTTNTGCTLNLVDCSGNTFSVDTCGTFGALSPYEYRANMSISTVLPAGGTVLDNFISNSQTYSNTQGGHSNKINTFGSQQGGQNAIGGGAFNIIGSNNVKIQLGNVAWSNIDGGFNNHITGNDHYFMNIGGGRLNEIRDGGMSHIGGGNENIITASTRTFIGGGESNHIRNESDYSSIVGGSTNFMIDASTSIIGGGLNNTINGQIGASILGGALNTITSGLGIGGNHSSILNGQNNTITHQSSAIIGGDSLTSDDSYTTFMNGLNVASASLGGNKYFRYHGGISNSGTIGDVLTQVDTQGNAMWMTPCCSGGTSTTGATFNKYVSTNDYIVNVPIVHVHGLGNPVTGALGVVINVWDEDGYKVDAEIREVNAFTVEVTLSETQNDVKVVII